MAKRVQRTGRSASNMAAQKARELIQSGRSVINMTAGEPDFDTPEHICAAGIEAIARGQTRYTTVDGTPELKQAIVDKFKRENNLSYTTKEVMVGCGAKHLIFNAFMATVEEGDEVVIPTPCWVSYPDMTRFAGGTPVMVACCADDDFKIKPEQLERAITTRTRWLVLNSPNNPSGSIYSAEELAALGGVLERHPHVLVMMDDIYEHLIFDGLKFATMAEAAPAIADRTLTINGVSKAYAMTGWRIGYAAGNAQLISQMSKIQTQSTSNPCSISQAASVVALNGPQNHIEIFRGRYQARRDMVIEALNQISGISCRKPHGAFYVFPTCTDIIGKKTPEGTIIQDDKELVLYFLENGVAGIAGSAYGSSGHFRLSIAASDEELEEGCRRVKTAIEALR
nr:pyridoxal phosphate-dependent aminotransferase [Brucella intermedia]